MTCSLGTLNGPVDALRALLCLLAGWGMKDSYREHVDCITLGTNC